MNGCPNYGFTAPGDCPPPTTFSIGQCLRCGHSPYMLYNGICSICEINQDRCAGIIDPDKAFDDEPYMSGYAWCSTCQDFLPAPCGYHVSTAWEDKR